MHIGNRHHQLKGQDACASSCLVGLKQPLCSWPREQQGSLRPRHPAAPRWLGCSVHLATLLEKAQRKEKHEERRWVPSPDCCSGGTGPRRRDLVMFSHFLAKGQIETGVKGAEEQCQGICSLSCW